MLWIDNAAFSSNYCSYLLYIFLQLGKIKVTAKWGLKIVRIHIQNSAIIMTNGIRKVWQGVDIFEKRILDSCKFISDSTLRIWSRLPEYFIDFFMWKWIPCQAVTSVLCLFYHPETVHCSTKNAYTSLSFIFTL